MNVLITGGHVTPALAVIDELQKKKVTMVFVGRRYAQSGEQSESYEYSEVVTRKVPFIHLETGRFIRILSVRSVIELAKALRGLLQSFSILSRQKPDIVLSFGGYIGLPVAFAARLRGVPVYIHEQTLIPGLSNRLIASFARRIFISFPRTADQFDKKKVMLTGDPVRRAIFRSNKGNFQIPSSRPVIYVTGGSLGAHALNKHIEQILDKLLEKYTIIHQTGAVRQYADYERLSKRASKYYIVQKHVSSAEIGYVYGRSSVVVSRAGANTVFELIALAKPAVVMPLPISAAGEQQAHARLLKDRGVAEIFSQERDSDVLFDLIEKVVDRRATYSKNFSNLANLYKKNAASLLVSEMLDSI